MKIIITLELSSYDYNTITHLVFDGIISVEEALQADCIMKLRDYERLGFIRMVTREKKLSKGTTMVVRNLKVG